MYERQRNELVKKLEQKGISDPAVLKTMKEIKRHLFVPKIMEHQAYKDIALPIGFGQTISQPYTVAYMTQALQAKPGDKILEVGTGSGYQAAILDKMGTQVYTIERNFDLYLKTQKFFDNIGLRVHAKCGDGTIGWDEFAPFDGIIVTAGSPDVPISLKKQLSVNGRLVIPVGDKVSQTLKVLIRVDEKNYDELDFPEFTFVPLIGREGWNEK
jgi:protein-L-isoaspartate(D-aspartate) O-methyltransferase